MPDSLESFWMFGKFLEGLKRFDESLKSFLTILKAVIQSGRFQINLEICQTVCKFSGQFEKFPESLECFDNLEDFRTVWKVSKMARKFPDSLERFWIIWKV